MSVNIEIKARAADFRELRQRAAALSDQPEESIHQEDTFFNVPLGRLKLRIFGPHHGQLIFYQRTDGREPKRSDYFVAESSQPDRLRDVLGRACGIRGIVRKRRLLYRVGATRIHLDDVEGLGHFVELEVPLIEGEDDAHGHEIAADLMAKLGIQHSSLVAAAYIDLLENAATPG